MSRKATPLDNAIVESFFHTPKTELVHQQKFESDIEAGARVVEFIEYYNRERLQSGIGCESPENYSRACA
ncbi:IS3 family transposase [uncultured Thalassolituus sp.]|uniref:IS3 family transposase n=1 Tax=uncultured Thalassolituus sp. TaxID=285273 RepID=UPI0035A27C3F